MVKNKLSVHIYQGLSLKNLNQSLTTKPEDLAIIKRSSTDKTLKKELNK